jgi:WD40 repeat protein
VDSLVSTAAFSDDGRTVAAGSDDGSVQLWNVGDQAPLGAKFTPHEGAVSSLDFSPDGTKLVSASADRTLRVSPVTRQSPEELRDASCAKLTHNMSDARWNRLVPAEIPYKEACPSLPHTDWAG